MAPEVEPTNLIGKQSHAANSVDDEGDDEETNESLDDSQSTIANRTVGFSLAKSFLFSLFLKLQFYSWRTYILLLTSGRCLFDNLAEAWNVN